MAVTSSTHAKFVNKLILSLKKHARHLTGDSGSTGLLHFDVHSDWMHIKFIAGEGSHLFLLILCLQIYYWQCLGFRSPQKRHADFCFKPSWLFLFPTTLRNHRYLWKEGGLKLLFPKSQADCIHKPSGLFFFIIIGDCILWEGSPGMIVVLSSLFVQAGVTLLVNSIEQICKCPGDTVKCLQILP